jgi:hypothetical protein
MPLEHDLMEIEREIWTGGPESYEAHTDKQCLVAFKEMAGVMARHDIAKSAEKGRWKDVSMQPRGIANLTDEAAIISYECTAKRKDGQPYHALVSSGYVKRAEGWKLAFHQQTPLP